MKRKFKPCDGQQYQQTTVMVSNINKMNIYLTSQAIQHKKEHHLVLEIEVLAWTGTKMQQGETG